MLLQVDECHWVRIRIVEGVCVLAAEKIERGSLTYGRNGLETETWRISGTRGAVVLNGFDFVKIAHTRQSSSKFGIALA